MMRLEVDAKFEAAHHLPNVPKGHKCGRVHGHSYAITVVFAGKVDASTGWVVDFADLRAIVDPVVAELDHRDLNEIVSNPTAEHLSMWIWHEVWTRTSVAFAAQIVEVIVSESGRSRVVYQGA